MIKHLPYIIIAVRQSRFAGLHLVMSQTLQGHCKVTTSYEV